MKKKNYENPSMNVLMLHTRQVVMASVGGNTSDLDSDSGYWTGEEGSISSLDLDNGEW